jgi:hypothetical protein
MNEQSLVSTYRETSYTGKSGVSDVLRSFILVAVGSNVYRGAVCRDLLH